MALSVSRMMGLTLLACAPGCSRDETRVVHAAGSGGGAPQVIAGAGGAAAGAAGMGGSAGAGGSPSVPDAGNERFQATLVSAYNYVSIQALDPVWVKICEVTPRLVQQLNGEWSPLRDDRPPYIHLQHQPHYLDGVFRSEDCAPSLGCDVDDCRPFAEDDFEYRLNHARLVPLEYFQTSTAAAGACLPDGGTVRLELADAGDAGVGSVPVIESRQPRGPLGVRVEYFRDSECRGTPITVDVPVE